MDTFENLLSGSAAAHGHLCPGQIVGVRMAMLGCRLIGLDEPTRLDQIKKLVVYVEMDRCTADAVAYVTGVRLGRRSLKFADYGIMAATFVNLETGAAFRVLSTEEARDLAEVYAPEMGNKREQQMAAYRRMPESVLFRVQRVTVHVSEADLPGPTRYRSVCSRCGQVVRDQKEIVRDNRVLCQPCSGDAYFSHAVEITWTGMEGAPEAAAGPSEDDGGKKG